MKKLILLLFVLAFLGSTLLASKVLDIGLYLYKNDTVALTDLSVSPGEPSRFTPKDGNYTFALIDDRGQTLSQMGLNPLFYILSDPPKPADHIFVSDSISYYSTARFFVVRHLGREIFRYELPLNATCNLNGRCDYGENAFSCPKDCKVSGDELCQPFDDGVCDSACPAGTDPDCRSTPRNESVPWLCLSGLGGLILALVAIVVIVFLALKTKKPESPDTKTGGEPKTERTQERKLRRKAVKKRTRPG